MPQQGSTTHNEALKFIIDKTQYGLLTWDAQEDVLWLSSSFKEKLNLETGNERLSLQYLNLVFHRQDITLLIEAIQSVGRDGKEIQEVVRLNPKLEPSLTWVTIKAYLYKSNKANEKLVVASISDSTETVIAKHALEAQRTDLRFIFDRVPAKIWYKDSNNKILRLNERAASSMGVTVEAAEGADTYELFPEMAKKYHEDDLSVLNTGIPLTNIVEKYTPLDGPHRWIKTDKYPYLDPTTNEQTLLVVSLDITDQKATEAELETKTESLRDTVKKLKESMSRFNLATEGSSVGIWEWPIETREALYWSPVYYELLGYLDKEIPASFEAFEKSIHPDDHKGFFEEVDLCLAEQRKLKIETRLRNKKGQYKWFLVSGRGEWDENAQPLRIIGSIMDIHQLKTAIVKAEEYSLELENANKELENFAYISSHDLKAPLRSIDNLAIWIGEDLEEVLTEDASKKLALIRSRVSRLEDMLKDILAYTDAGKHFSKPEKLNMDSLFDEMIDWISPPESFEIIKLNQLPNITMTKSMMEQILLNLISNSVKHINRNDGIITISSKEYESLFEFVITDNGPGIPKEYHDYVFELFKTLKPRDKVEGSGIGLSIVKKILNSIGGEVWISDEGNDEGVSFHFTIPKKSQQTLSFSQMTKQTAC